MRSAAVSSLRRSLGSSRSCSSSLWRQQQQQLAEWDGGSGRRAARAANCLIVVRPRRWERRRLLSFSAPSAAAAERPPPAHRLTPEAREEVSRVLELAERAAARWTLDQSCFLPPPTVAAALAALEPRGDVAGVAWGGFAGAERTRIIVGRPEDLRRVVRAEEEGEDEEDEEREDGGSSSGEGEGWSDDDEQGGFGRGRRPRNRRKPRNVLDLSDPAVGGVSAVSISGNFAFDQASHRDFLGAVLNSAGIDRRVCGDVVVRGERGATALVSSDVAEALALSLTRVRSVTVEATQIPLKELDFPIAAAAAMAPAAPVAVRSVEASMRLDAVASAGFRSPRSAAASAARAGELKLNYGEAKASAAVSEGDLMSWRGKGRVKVVGVGTTKKGKFAVEMERFTS